MDADVIVVGAGPTGLMLAGELRLGGARVTVLERTAERSWESRGLGFTARASEVLHQRGLLERLENVEISPRGHFGGIPLDYTILEGSHFGVRGVPQHRIEEMLESWALELGATLLRGHELSDLVVIDSGVRAIVTGPDGDREYEAAYLVGCDGGRSTVRRLAGFDFQGHDATREMYLADVAGCDIRPRMIGELLPNGMVMAGALEDGYFRIIVCENGISPDKDRRVGFADVADAWQRLTGESIHHGQARWVSRFTDATRQVTEYRRGPVLLAGDAAHIHLPAGGQGLSIGVQDAVNLGWKLAARVRGWAPDDLLDTYHNERHPVGARVLRNTRAQGTLNLTGRSIEPVRTVMAQLMAIPAVARHLSGMVSGLDIRYDMCAPAGHPLLGSRLPDRALPLADGGQVQVAELLHPARGLVITADTSAATVEAAAGWSDRVDVVRVSNAPIEAESVLVRPDGYIAWTAPGPEPLPDSLRRWFGAPNTAVARSARRSRETVR